jgi:hypothetical protein
VATTVIYMHVLKMGGGAMRSPLDALVARATPKRTLMSFCSWPEGAPHQPAAADR